MVDSALHDRLGRGIGYLRLSLTKACSMRCTYCRPAEFEAPKGEATLSAGEIRQLVEHLSARHGLYKVRLTGGEPTIRGDLMEIIESVASVEGIRDLAMTTNGLTLARRAKDYAGAGLKRINISLDTLDSARFERMTGVDGLDRVLSGIDAAREAGLNPIRLNSVVIKGGNDADLNGLIRFAAKKNVEIRFIELMPMGPLADRWQERYVPEAAMRSEIKKIGATWWPVEQGHDSARRYRIALDDGSVATVGFITPMSCNFCGACNRIRVGSDGTLFPCLMDVPRGTILSALRPHFDGELLDDILRAGLGGKQAEHPHDGWVTMTAIGG